MACCRIRWMVLFALGAFELPALAQQLSTDDRTRVAEFYRFAAANQEGLWPGWSEVSAPLLLVTAQGEFLTHNTKMSEGFRKVDDDYLWRERQFPTNMMATFPALGERSLIIIGQPANTDAKTSTSWIFFAMHEHFHHCSMRSRVTTANCKR